MTVVEAPCERGDRLSGLGFFAGKTVVVAGATSRLGTSLTRRLASLGGMVVAIDTDEAALTALAGHAPSRIEVLAMDLRDSQRSRLLREIWAEEPIDALLNLLPLSQPPEATAGLFRALAGGTRSGAARTLSLFAQPGDRSRPGQVFDAAGWRGFLEALVLDNARHRVLGIEPSGAATQDRVVQLGDLALMMCHPVSDALADGLVLHTNRPGK